MPKVYPASAAQSNDLLLEDIFGEVVPSSSRTAASQNEIETVKEAWQPGANFDKIREQNNEQGDGNADDIPPNHISTSANQFKSDNAKSPHLLHKRASINSHIILFIKIWFTVFIRTLPSIWLCFLFMILYYAPGRLMVVSTVESVRQILYIELLGVFQNLFIFSTYSQCMSHIFGDYFTMSPGHKVLFPFFCIALVIMACSFIEINLRRTLALFIDLFAPIVYLYKLKNSKIPSDMDSRMKDYFILTQDGTIKALVKGWFLFFLVVPIFSNIIKVYLKLSVEIQLLVRIILVPCCIFLASFLQYYFLVGLSIGHMEKRLLVLSCTDQFLQFLGRMMVSNISSGSRSSWYWAINLGMVFIEFMARTSFIYRHTLYKRFKDFASSHNAANQNDPAISSGRGVSSYTLRMRVERLISESEADFRIIFLVPLIMYFLDPVYPDSGFQTISKIEDALYQIGVQLICKFFGDTISMTAEFYFVGLPYGKENLSLKDTAMGMNVSLSMICVLYVHQLVSTSSKSK